MAAILLVNRRSVVIPILLMACFVAPGQRIVLFGLDFNFIRILTLTGWTRVLAKNEQSHFVWSVIDKALIFWAICSMAAYVFLHKSTGAFVYKLGTSFDSIGMYFLFRFLIRDLDDIKHLTVSLLCLSIPVAFFLLLERHTGRNIFSVFGGVPEFTAIRNGKLRAQGAFAHPILAGCFWVTQLPLFLALFWQKINRWLVVSGVVATFAIIYACASSTPAAGIGAVVIGGILYIYRHHMKMIRWGVFVTLVVIHMVMKAPVWHLVSRLDIVGGSTGWQRYFLIDQTINRFGEWWAMGTLSTTHWGWGLWDTANMYVNEAVNGGLVTLVLFVTILALAFQGVGRLLVILEDNNPDHVFAWALGVSLFTHCMVFISVSYFGQIIVVWYLLLATIGSLSALRGYESTEPAVDMVTPKTRLVIKW